MPYATGACNPSLAHRALQAELGVGVMLPCNVIVYADGDDTVVIAVDPMETIAARSATLRPIADEVRTKLTRISERVRHGELFATLHTREVFLNRLIGPHGDAITYTPITRSTAVRLESLADGTR